MKSNYHIEFHRIPRQSKFHVFRGMERSAGHTWHFMGGSGDATCPRQNGSNNEPSGAHMRHMA